MPALRDPAPACRGCELWEPATQVVFSTGEPNAKVMLVGEQPDLAHLLAGKPWPDAELVEVDRTI